MHKLTDAEATALGFDTGVPVQMHSALTALADHAVARWGTARDVPEVFDTHWVATSLMFEATRDYVSLGHLTEAQMLGWLTVVASAPDYETARNAAGVLSALKFGTDEHPNGWWVRWLQMPNALGPIAWAAGLSIDEAMTRWTAGTLDIEGLRVLAGLRGWALPPTPVQV